MIRRFRDLATLTALVVSLAGACIEPPRSSSDEAGTIRAALQLWSGTTLNTVSYAIGGPGGFARAGNVDVSHSTTISFTVGGIPAGQGYNVSLNGTASVGTTTCSGAAMFDITPKMTTMLSIKVQCREQPRTGSVMINGTVNVCPVVEGVSANPGEVMVGFSSGLSATAHDSDGRPAAVTYSWVATSGMLAGATTRHRRCSARRRGRQSSRSRSATATAPTPAASPSSARRHRRRRRWCGSTRSNPTRAFPAIGSSSQRRRLAGGHRRVHLSRQQRRERIRDPGRDDAGPGRLLRAGGCGVHVRARRRRLGAPVRSGGGDRRHVHVDRTRGHDVRPLP